MVIVAERVRVPVTPEEVRARIARVPRVSLALTPTPLHELPRLAAELGVGRLFVKRDDLTGLPALFAFKDELLSA